MTYTSWEPRYRVTTIAPGKLDLFVLTLLNGRRADVRPIMEYESAVAKAEAFAAIHRCQIKVLPMTGPEFRNYLNLPRENGPKTMGEADRAEAINVLADVARNSSDEDAQRDAFDLFREMSARPS